MVLSVTWSPVQEQIVLPTTLPAFVSPFALPFLSIYLFLLYLRKVGHIGAFTLSCFLVFTMPLQLFLYPPVGSRNNRSRKCDCWRFLWHHDLASSLLQLTGSMHLATRPQRKPFPSLHALLSSLFYFLPLQHRICYPWEAFVHINKNIFRRSFGLNAFLETSSDRICFPLS